jgi:hypothetical protein
MNEAKLEQLYDEYQSNGSNCCSALIVNGDICTACKEHCQDFQNFLESYADFTEAQ